jgi:hypothetical protein
MISGDMNTENTKSRSKLEQLSPEQQEMLLELAKRSTLEVLAESLKEHGIETSDSALSRFLQKRRAADAVAHGKELAASVEALAEQGRGGKLREGTLEVMRQQFFEKAAGGVGGDEAQALYAALVTEEARVKELELEARKVAALEQQVRLQERRIEVEAMKARAALGRVRAQVVDGANVQDGERAKLEPGGPRTDREQAAGLGKTPALLVGGQVGEANGGRDVIEGLEAARSMDAQPTKPKAPDVEDNQRRLLEAVKRAEGILNRGGDLGERILEARGLLGEAVREFEER